MTVSLGNDRNLNERKLFVQIIEAFKPFSVLESEPTKEFLDAIGEKSLEITQSIDKRAKELLREKVALKERVEQIKKFQEESLLDNEEALKLLRMKKAAIAENKTKLRLVSQDEDSLLHQGKKVIELLQKSYDFMQLSDNELAKARLAKIVLSNPTLKNRSLRYCYQNPFDNLLKILTVPEWWRRGELNPRPQTIHIKALHA